MKKVSIAAAAAVCLLPAGCTAGGTTEADTDAGSGDVREEMADKDSDGDQAGLYAPSASEQGDASSASEQGETPAYEAPDSLPVYSYGGSEEYLGVISDYLVDEGRRVHTGDVADVYIPFSVIVETDDSDPEDIAVYGSYNIDGYELLNTTLATCVGSYGCGVFHIGKRPDGSYEVISADLAEVEEEWTDIFAPVEGLYERIVALSEDEIRQARETAIAAYVHANGLNITQWQNYGWPPVAVLNAPPTPEEAQLYTYRSTLGYALTYDLREYSLSRSDGEDMFGRIEDIDTGTLMVVRRAKSKSTDEALKEASAGSRTEDIAVSDAAIGDHIVCRRTEWNEALDDGRIFRYICYAVRTEGDILTVTIETTYEKGVSEMPTEDLEREFQGILSSFAIL